MEIKKMDMFNNSEEESYSKVEPSEKNLNINLIGSIQHGNENDCPVLYLKNSTSDIGVSLRLIKNSFIHVTNYDKKIKFERCGQSEGGFSASLDFIGALSKEVSQSDITSIKDIIIFGNICEALCKSEFPVKNIIFNADRLDEFLEASLEYYGYDTSIYKFNFSNLEPLIDIKEIDINNNTIDGDLKRFILHGEITLQGLYCKGFLGIAKNCVYIRSRYDKAYGIMLPNILRYVDDNTIKNDVIKALSWILLGFTGFIVSKDSEFINLNPEFKFNLSYRYFIHAVFMDPINFSYLLMNISV